MDQYKLEKISIQLQDAVFKKQDYLSLNKILDDNETNLNNIVLEMMSLNLSQSNKFDVYKSILSRLFTKEEFKKEFDALILSNKESIALIKNEKIIDYIIPYITSRYQKFIVEFKHEKASVNDDYKIESLLTKISEFGKVVNLLYKVFIFNETIIAHCSVVNSLLFLHEFLVNDGIISIVLVSNNDDNDSCHINSSFNELSFKNIDFYFYLNYFYENINSNTTYLARFFDMLMKFYSKNKELLLKNNNYDYQLSKDISLINHFNNLLINFFSYDDLTKLILIEIIENMIEDSKLTNYIITKIDFFNKLNTLEGNNNGTFQHLLRKYLYFLSKFYGSLRNKTGIIVVEEVFSKALLKNTISISLQHSEETGNMEFITSIFSNIFHNIQIFSFLLDSETNKNFDFKNEVINILIVNYYSEKDYKNKISTMHAFTNMFNPNHGCSDKITYKEEDVNSHMKFLDVFLKEFYFVYTGKKNISSSDVKDKDDVINLSEVSFFVLRLYKDFQTHDFEEYESSFLDVLSAMICIEKFVYSALMNFDLTLYLLNKRSKEKIICEKKYLIIEKIYASEVFKQKAQEEIVKQFREYIRNGVY